MTIPSSSPSPSSFAKSSGEGRDATKERTWPVCVCQDPTDPTLWNVRGLDGVVIFTPGLSDKFVARQACRGINEHFDHGRDR